MALRSLAGLPLMRRVLAVRLRDRAGCPTCCRAAAAGLGPTWVGCGDDEEYVMWPAPAPTAGVAGRELEDEWSLEERAWLFAMPRPPWVCVVTYSADGAVVVAAWDEPSALAGVEQARACQPTRPFPPGRGADLGQPRPRRRAGGCAAPALAKRLRRTAAELKAETHRLAPTLPPSSPCSARSRAPCCIWPTRASTARRRTSCSTRTRPRRA
ncbi:hypothetical protein BDY21DRAFT_343363 [Lineolata rhizophorae]|uniref:Anaphase-promoting complex subunit 4 WD40 domain-containing protein n=1 Tax=Lineolata rhizophorae TaxID=578093 RepID=A0A6A6P2K7_9PEZI|nr:hypothetical protein BDY21DRAFT_343363 [Lineolata rhizophorae]